MPLYFSDDTTSSTNRYFPALTGIRAVAAYMVVLFHLNPLLGTTYNNIGLRWLNYFIQQLHVGVPVFFVLSGFLIAYRYLDRVELTKEWLTSYLWFRLTRIYPIYFILTVSTFLLLQFISTDTIPTWHTTEVPWKDKLVLIFLNITLLKAFFHSALTSGIPTAWSLTVEETFYILAPLLLIGLRVKQSRFIIYSILLLSLGSLLVFLCSLSTQYLYGFMSSMNFMLRFTFFGRCTEFIAGIALAFYIKKEYRHFSLNHSAATLSGSLGIIACIIALAVIKVQHTPTAFWPTSQWSILVQNFILPFAIVVLFYGLLHEQSLLRKLLETKLLLLLGKSSYALYLIHIGIFHSLFTYYISENTLICLVIYSLIAILLYKFIEKPAQGYLRNSWQRRHKQIG